MTRGEFQCRTRLCGWCSLAMEILTGEIIDVSMPHAALWVVQQEDSYDGNADWEFQCRTRLCGWYSEMEDFKMEKMKVVSMPHAALWVVQHQIVNIGGLLLGVSMPHAALWVVQLAIGALSFSGVLFQCRTRLCGWCSNPWRL